MIPNNIELTKRIQALIDEAIATNPNDDVYSLTIKVKLRLPELNEPATTHMSDESLMRWIHNTQEKETLTMAKPTDNTPKKNTPKKKTTAKKKTKKTTGKSKKLTNVPEEVLAPFTNPQETTPMAEPTDNTDNNTSNIDNSVDTNVQEDTIPTNNTPDDQPCKTEHEIMDMLSDQLKDYIRLRRTLVHQDNSETPTAVNIEKIYQVLSAISRDERVFLATLLMTPGADSSLKEYRLTALGAGQLPSGGFVEVEEKLVSLTPKKRFLGLSKQTNVQVHASLSPTLAAMQAAYNQESVVENNNNENSEQTPNWFNRTRTHMADGLGSAKERMSDANIGERMTRVAKSTGSWVWEATLTVAERIIENLGLAAKWTVVSFYGLWFYVIFVMFLGQGATLGAALIATLYIMAVWTAKTFAWVLAWLLVVDLTMMGYSSAVDWMDERKFATQTVTAEA